MTSFCDVCKIQTLPFGYADVTVASWNNLFRHIPVLLSSKPKPSSKGACLHWWTTSTGVNVAMFYGMTTRFDILFFLSLLYYNGASTVRWRVGDVSKNYLLLCPCYLAWVCACMCMEGGGGAILGPLQSSRAQDGPDVTGTYMHETMTSGSTYYCTTF